MLNKIILKNFSVFGRSFVKRFAPCYQTVVCLSCLSCLSCLWRSCTLAKGWADQYETWHAGRPRPYGDPALLPQRAEPPPFSAHICCVQLAAWIKMSLGMELGLSPGDFVLDGDRASPPQKKRGRPQIFGPCLLWPNGWMDEAGTWHGGRPQPRRLC